MPKILIVGPAWVGDMVMAQSLFKVIKQAQPRTALSVLAPPWTLPLLARMPEVDAAVQSPLRHGQFKLRAMRQLARELRTHKFDRAIVLPSSLKSALAPWLAKIPTRTGYVGELRYGVLNDRRRLDKAALPMNVQRFIALGLPKSASVPDVCTIPHPKLAVKRTRAEESAASFGLQAKPAPNNVVVALCPGAEYGPAKQWPAEHFAEVAQQQLQRGRQVWILGGEKEQGIAARINKICAGRCADLSGRTTLGEAIDLLSLAKYAVTNDSGLMHVAAAVGCHVIAIYGSSSDEFTPPLTKRYTRLSLGLACSPCFKRECPLGHLNCLRKLGADMVTEVLK